MSEPPEVDGRRREDIREDVEAIAPYYTESWNPESEGPGTTLLALFAEMAEDVVERLDRVPEKHRIAFFDTLGFDRRPPQPAQVPLSFQIADGAGQNVVVDDGTQAVAAATDSRPEQTFEIGDDGRFEATPANLASIYSVDPAVDGIYDHWDPPEDEGLSDGKEQSLFMGQNQQKHALYIGHADQLNVTSDSESGAGTATVRVKLDTKTSWKVLRNDLVWEYYGERTEDGELKEGWHTFTRQPAGWETLPGKLAWFSWAILSRIPPTVRLDDSTEDERVLDLGVDGTLTETTVNGIESRWIRVSVPEYSDVEDFSDLQIGTSVRVGPGPTVEKDGTNGDGDGGDGGASPKTMAPDQLLYNDVPLPFGTADSADGDDEETPPYYPLGIEPQVQNTFYVASSEAFTKSDARVQLSFSGLDGEILPTNTAPEPKLSWEYWNGSGWARIDGLDDETNLLTGSGNATDGTVTFTVPDDLVKTTVSGHQNHWIRCRLVGGAYGKRKATRSDDWKTWTTHHDVNPPNFTRLTIEYVSSDSSSSGEGGSPEETGDGEEGGGEDASVLPSKAATHLFAENNLACSDNLAEEDREQVSPFEPLPDDEQTLYLGFDGRLHDGPITLFFEIADQAYPTDFHSRVRWEYCADPAGDEWVRLDVQDGTEGLTERGIVSLIFSGETASGPRFGLESHWIRARVTGKPFEPLVFQVPFDPSALNPSALDFGAFGPGQFDVGPIDLGWFDPVVPFFIDSNLTWTQPLLETETIGPRTTVGGASSIDEVTSRVRSTTEPTVLNRRANVPESAGATKIPDVTEFTGTSTSTQPIWRTEVMPHLSDTSIIEGIATGGLFHAARWFDSATIGNVLDVRKHFALPQLPTIPQFPVIPKWIGPWLPFLPRKRTDEEPGPIEPCGWTLETEPPSGDPTKLPPTVNDLSTNTGWAYNVRTVENETLGSSDGSRSQTFVAANPPAVDETVWVDELDALSEDKRRELREAETPAVETTDGDGSLQAFWVAWSEVPNFLDSDEDDRHYTVDRTAGQIIFGNGTQGRIPPRGEDNVRISYRTGGGPDGNVDVGAVAELKNSLQFVDSVTNPVPGTGGASAESTDRAVSRAPKQLRDRDRAVTEVDYERIAMDGTRRIARAECIPDMNQEGESDPGWVTLLIVPNAPRTKPFPSTGLKEQVWEAVSDRAPATVVAADRLVVRGPSYVEVTVDTDVVAEGRRSVATLEESVTGELEAFLHPLSGGEEKEGWAFGELPAMSDLYALIEGVHGVDHVADLSVRFETSERVTTIREGEESPSVSADALVYSGGHEVTVGLGAPRTGTELEEA